MTQSYFSISPYGEILVVLPEVHVEVNGASEIFDFEKEGDEWGYDQGVDLDLEVGVDFQCDVFQDCCALGKGDFVEYSVYVEFAGVAGFGLVVLFADGSVLRVVGW